MPLKSPRSAGWCRCRRARAVHLQAEVLVLARIGLSSRAASGFNDGSAALQRHARLQSAEQQQCRRSRDRPVGVVALAEHVARHGLSYTPSGR